MLTCSNTNRRLLNDTKVSVSLYGKDLEIEKKDYIGASIDQELSFKTQYENKFPSFQTK